MNEPMQKNSQFDENIEIFFENDKECFHKIDENHQINQTFFNEELIKEHYPPLALKFNEENHITKNFWLETINYKANEFEKFEEMCLEKKTKWEGEMHNEGKAEIDLFLENLEMF